MPLRVYPFLWDLVCISLCFEIDFVERCFFITFRMTK